MARAGSKTNPEERENGEKVYENAPNTYITAKNSGIGKWTR